VPYGVIAKPSLCPYQMGNRVHPSESLAAYFPWLAGEWRPTKGELRPDQVTRASGHAVIWRCAEGHEWAAVVYARTLSRSGCPTCYRLETSERIKAGKKRACQIRDEQAAVQVAALMLDEPADENL
jgi:hypothetical protein